MRLLPVLPLILAATGCYYPHPPPPPPPPELASAIAAAANCAETVFPLNPRVDGWSVDKFTGRYARGSESLTVTRSEHRLLVARAGFGTREIAADNVESWHWHDACGVRYDFTLPPDGPGAWLRITDATGMISDWRR
jgi:hypothetical protein